MLRQLVRKMRGPRCHLSPEEKDWIEQRFVWLREQFGPNPIRREPLVPGSDFLPSHWDASYDAGADLFRRMCEFMQVDNSDLRLHFYSQEETHEHHSEYAGESQHSGPAGLYYHPKEGQKKVIALQEELLTEPAHLAATICHELGHVRLLGERRMDGSEADGEHLTDLLTVYFGAGMLTANAAFQFSQWQSLNMQGWQVRRSGYLSEPMFGYALGCYCWFRGDKLAPWRKHLRENIEYYFSDSLHFLECTSDTRLPFDGA